MGIIEAIAIIIFVLAILILIYYFLQNNPATVQKIQSYVPSSYGDSSQINNDLDFHEETVEELDDNESMGKKIKVKLSDIDMSSFNTDAFSKKIDAFLDEKSDQLIQDWELATKTDLKAIEERFNTTSKSIDKLEEKFNSFKDDSNKKFDDIEKRIEKLEEE